ncbi:MAG: 30S ribosomal protein S6 [Minisyncoccia bacterium]
MKNSVKSGDGLSVYELCFLILPSIPEDKLSDAVDLIRQVVSKAGGKEIDAEEPFKYPLSYEMSKTVGSSRYVVSEAYLGWLKFELEPSKVLEVKGGVDKVNEVLRFILLKVPRETTFTFAKARARALEREREKGRVAEEGASPSPVEEQVLN